MKKTHLTNDFYEQAQHIIYNDLPTDVLYPVSKTVAYFNQEVVERIVEKGEKWIKLTLDDGRVVAYTSYGRLINTKTVKVLSCSFSRKNILHYFSDNKFKSSEIFEREGWEHNMQELADRYQEKGWNTLHNYYYPSR